MSQSIIEGPVSEWDELKSCVHELVIQQALKTPNAPAITEGDITVSYSTVVQNSEVLSMCLKTCGITVDTPVAIFMEHSIEYVYAYMGALMANGPYLALGLSQPKPMLSGILTDSDVKVVLTKSKYVDKLPLDYAGTVLCLDVDGWPLIKEMASHWIDDGVRATPDDLCFILYSSGTTGKPKGIQAPHLAVVNSYVWRLKNSPNTPQDRIAVNVFFVWECLRPLMEGAQVFIIPDEVIYNPFALINYLEKNEITSVLFTPSLCQALLDVPQNDVELSIRLKSMRLVWLCGEVVATELQKQFLDKLPHCELWNLYSVSECHDVSVSNLSVIDENKQKNEKYCSCGEIMDNVEVIVLDDNMNNVPQGVIGELYVGGKSLARGYLNEDLTRKRFPPHPFKKGEILYKTGDIARILDDGTLEIRGRCDSMVKIRGYSVELGAVEATLAEHPSVRSARAVVDGDDLLKRRLIGYVVLQEPVSGVELRNSMRDYLPHYMIPNIIVQLDELPIGTSWKLGKLPKPEDVPEKILSGNYCAPRTEIEEKLLGYLLELLEISHVIQVGVRDNFFDLGGNSFELARLFAFIEQLDEYNGRLTLPDIYENPTVEGIAKILERDEAENINFEIEHLGLLPDTVVPVGAVSDTFHNIFLTGCTGYLGAFLLKELLAKSDQIIVYCHVRANSKSAGFDRIRTNMISHMCWNDSYVNRIKTIVGDLGSVHCGISDNEWETLSTNIDAIYHNGAIVDFMKNYNTLKQVNVGSVIELLKLATTNKTKPFMLVSTVGVFGADEQNVQKCDVVPNHEYISICTGYEKTKFVAEKVVEEAFKRGIPGLIMRPGNITGDSVTGSCNYNHDLVLFIQGIIELKTAPMWSKVIDMTPVDMISRTMINYEIPREVPEYENRFINFLNPNLVSMNFVLAKVAEYYDIKLMEYSAWTNVLSKSISQGENNPLTPLFSMFNDDIYACSPSFTTVHNYWNEADFLTADYYLNQMMRFLIRMKTIPFSPKQPLFGKRFVITGASAGIGKEITRALHEKGSFLCIGARREERLQEIKQHLCGTESDDIIFSKTDVTVQEDVQQLSDYCLNHWGGIDGIILNAGIMPYTQMEHCEVGQWSQCIDINVKGVLHGIASVLPHMLENANGDILVMSSDAGKAVFPNLTVYSASKFAVEAICQGLRAETFGRGIRVMAIQPGDVESELWIYSEGNPGVEDYEFAAKILEPSVISSAVVYALSQPRHVGVHELMIEPTGNV